MPDLEVEDAFNGPQFINQPPLKGHKTLPRQRKFQPKLELIDTTPAINVQDDMLNGADMPITPKLPLTPPNHIQEDIQHNSSPRLNRRRSLPLNHNNMATSTPRSHQFSPPTPDVTPPRVRDTTPKARQAFPSLQSSMSSRTTSFQTARENMSDDDAMDSLYPSAHSLVLRQRERSFPEPSPLANDFDSLSDSTENQHGKEYLNTRVTAKLKIPGPIGDQQGQRRTPRLASSPLPKSRPNGITSRNHREVDGVSSPEQNRKSSITRSYYPSPERSDIGKSDGNSDSDLTETEEKLMDQVNTRRFSGVSFTSTIEAVVIDASPPKTRTLRHIEKKSSLRSVSSAQTQHESTRMSTEPRVDSPHRLVRRSGRISNENRHSVASDMSIPFSTTSSNTLKTEVIPVVVVPQRRSSLKSSAASIGNQPTVRSTTPSRRKNSVSHSRANDQNPPRRKRTMSDAASSAAGQNGRESRGRGEYRPSIPQRSSSLSAPTSRSNSRSTTLTSESLRRHTEQMQLAFEGSKSNRFSDVLPSPKIVLPDRSDPQVAGASVPVPFLPNMDDINRLYAPSLHFTQSSAVSSSPGPFEIREATMVTYFPHNNESLVMINPFIQPESVAVQSLRGQELSASVNLRTPEQSTAMLNVESPLRNPRTPPVPPTQNAVVPDFADENNRQSRRPDLSRQGSNRLSRGFGSMKRALSARRNSDVVRQQPVTRSLSVRSAKSRRAEKARDSELYSFWRPRGFWDDFDSSPSNERATPNEQTWYRKEKEDVFVSNSLGLPQKRVVFNGPLVLARRISKSRKARRRRGAQQQQYSKSDLDLAMGITRPQSPYQRRTVKVRLQRGVFYPVRVFRRVRRRVKEARQMRARAALEARRERLKRSIGAKTLSDPYSVGPFNHGAPYEDATHAPRMNRGLY